MRAPLLFLVAVCVVTHSFAESPKTVAKLITEIEHAVSEMRNDRNRKQPLQFADLDTSNLSADELAEISTILRDSLADTKAASRRPYPGLTEAERQAANDSLKQLAFKTGTQISDATKKELAAYFRSHPSLDPRILSVSYVDKTTIQIVSGATTGWCATGLNFYVGRHENARWVVRSGLLADNGR